MTKTIKTIEQELNEVCEEMGVKTRKGKGTSARKESEASGIRVTKEDEKEFWRALKEEERAQPKGTRLLVKKVRDRAKLSKDKFDMTAIELARRHVETGEEGVILHRYDYPESLSREGKERLVKWREDYYVGIERAYPEV